MNALLLVVALGAQASDWNYVTCSNTYAAPARTNVSAGLCSIPENAPPDEELIITVQSGDFRTLAGITEITPPLVIGGRVVRGRQVNIKVINPSPLYVLADWKITIKWLDGISRAGFESR